MAEYVYVPEQTVQPNQAAIFSDSIPCTSGNVYHREQSGNFILRGNTCNSFARYSVTFNGNIAVPEGGTAGAISLALSLNGEALPSSNAIVTPTVAQAYFNVSSVAQITVPRGCCFDVTVKNTSSQAIDIQNANLVITRIA